MLLNFCPLLAIQLVRVMDPFYHFREWSEQEAAKLMKQTGTIEDVDGEYSLRISGKSPRICRLPPHYRIALHALNKRFGLYKKIVVHLKKSSNASAPTLRNLYLSLINYMHNVRISFVADAFHSVTPLDGRFRSPAMDYYLWLDHKAGGFHSQCREILANDHHVTFDDVKNGISADILALGSCSNIYLIYLYLICDKSIGVHITP